MHLWLLAVLDYACAIKTDAMQQLLGPGGEMALTIPEVADESVLNRAYEWLCRRRKRFPAAADVWSFRLRWPEERARLSAELIEGTYRFTLLSRVTLRSGEEVDIWSARDAVVPDARAAAIGETPRENVHRQD